MSTQSTEISKLELKIGKLEAEQGDYARFLGGESCTPAQHTIYLACYVDRHHLITKTRKQIRKLNF